MASLLSTSPILLPIVCLVIWTMASIFFMAATRLPAIAAAKLGPDSGRRAQELAAQLPKEVQWKADNYNHLLEQPTAFYACALVLAIAGLGDGLSLYFAWGYVVIRVVPSFVQSTVKPVLLRFSLFLLSSILLTVMAVYGAISLVN